MDLAAEEQALRISQLLGRLDAEFIGLAPVKDRVREIAALLLIDRLRGRYGLTSSRPSLHMCFTGSPGTGKTTVATHMGELLRELGYLRKGQLVSVTRDDLVGQYVGHTAPKTKEVLKRAMGGVLLIDEAYYLYRPENERDYGQESIEILLQFMEAHREDLVVILAGYADRMDTFFRSNPGMASRIAHHIDFPDFTLDELLQIAEKMLEREQYRLSPAAREAFAEYVRLRMSQPRFANARSIRNAIDRLRLRQARRLVAGGGLIARGDLMEISAEDVRASRVFRDAGHPDPTTGGPAGEAAHPAQHGPPGDKLTGPPGPPSPGGGGSSGTVSRTVVPRFGEEDSSSLPPSSSARSRMAARPKPVGWLPPLPPSRRGNGPAIGCAHGTDRRRVEASAVVDHLQHHLVPLQVEADPDVARVRVLGHVLQRLLSGAVHGDLDVLGHPATGGLDLNVELREGVAQALQAGGQPEVVEYRRAQPGDRGPGLVQRGGGQFLGQRDLLGRCLGVAGDGIGRGRQVEEQAHDALADPVVDLPGESAALVLLPFDRLLRELLERLLPLGQAPVQPGVLDRARDQARHRAQEFGVGGGELPAQPRVHVQHPHQVTERGHDGD